MVAVAQTCSPGVIEALATALRLSAQGDTAKKDAIVNELEEHTQGGGGEAQQQAARRLMSEVGGTSAMKKLAVRSSIGEKVRRGKGALGALLRGPGGRKEGMLGAPTRLWLFLAAVFDLLPIPPHPGSTKS